MIKDITIGQYYSANSVVHRMDARMKIVLTFALIISIFLCKSIPSLALIVLITVALILVSRVPLKMVLKSVKPIAVIVIFTGLLNLFYVRGGTPLLDWHFIHITSKGIFTAVFMAIRIICLVIISSLLTYTTTPTMLTDAIERLLSPLKIFKVPVHTLAMMMTIALRFIPTLIEEAEKIMNAQKARGADLENGSLKDRVKALIPILIPLLISAVRRAYELAEAMECRCYSGGEGRTRMKQMHLKARDLWVSLVSAAMCGGVIALNILF